MTGWTMGQKNTLAVAAAAAPSVHKHPAVGALELGSERRAAEIHELVGRALPRHDPFGRDRLISCGAALEHVSVAARVLGYSTTT